VDQYVYCEPMSFFRRRTQKERAEGMPNAVFDRALFERVEAIAREEVGELAGSGGVTIRTEPDGDGDKDGGDIYLEPTRPGATGIWLGMWDDTVAFGTGGAGASNEIWSTVDEDWERTLRQMIRCVRDGRYSERVHKGRLTPLKVDMKFEGVPSGPDDRYPDFTPRYWSTLAAEGGDLPMPPTGDFTYDPW